MPTYWVSATVWCRIQIEASGRTHHDRRQMTRRRAPLFGCSFLRTYPVARDSQAVRSNKDGEARLSKVYGIPRNASRWAGKFTRIPRIPLLNLRQQVRNQLHALDQHPEVIKAVRTRMESLLSIFQAQIDEVEVEIAAALNQDSARAAAAERLQSIKGIVWVTAAWTLIPVGSRL
jgi:hypothetical protein